MQSDGSQSEGSEILARRVPTTRAACGMSKKDNCDAVRICPAVAIMKDVRRLSSVYKREGVILICCGGDKLDPAQITTERGLASQRNHTTKYKVASMWGCYE